MNRKVSFLLLSILFLGTVSVFAGNVFVSESGISAEFSSSSGSEGASYNVTYKGEDDGLHVMMFEDGIFVGIANESEGPAGNGSWWDSSWGKRKQVIITETSGADLVNYSVLLNVSYEAEMQADFDDLRFVMDNESLPYYVEDKVDSDWVGIYIKMPSLNASVNTTVEMYYDNSGVASASSEVGIDKAGLVAYYELDETSGAILDSLGNFNGSYNGDLYSQSGRVDTSIGFDGSNDYIDIDNDAASLDGANFTVSGWFYADDFGKNNRISKGDNIDPYRQLFSIGTNTNGYPSLSFYGDDASSSISCAVQTWCHITGTYDASINEQKIYVNGNLGGTDTTSADLSNTNPYNLKLGYSNQGTHMMDGRLDEVGVWNRVLSGEDVSGLYNSNSGKAIYAENEPAISFGMVESR